MAIKPKMGLVRRSIGHARKYAWSYGVGAVVLTAVIGWLVPKLCDDATARCKRLEEHYRCIETNYQAMLVLSERQRQQWLTNRLQDDQIRALQWQIKRLESQ